MLQQNQISNLLKSALLAPTQASSQATSEFRPVSISLLSNHGNPLISLTTKPSHQSQQQQQQQQQPQHQDPQQSLSNDRQWQLQPVLQLHSLHSSKAGTPTTTTSATAALGGVPGADDYEHGYGERPSSCTPFDSQAGGDVSITLDQLKIYSLLAYNSTIENNNQETNDSGKEGGSASGDEYWSIVDFGNVKCIISRIELGGSSKVGNNHQRGNTDKGQDIKRTDNSLTTAAYNNNKKGAPDAGESSDADDYNEEGDSFDGYFVVLFYQQSKPSIVKSTNGSAEAAADSGSSSSAIEVDAIAKVKIDAVVNALSEGLKGYQREPKITY